MTSNVKLILYLSCIHIVIGIPLSDELHQYTISVVQHYHRQKPGLFKCVFYDLSAGTDDGWFGKLLSSPQLSNVPKHVLDENYHLSLGESCLRQPDLMLVHVGDRDLSPSKCPNVVNYFFTVLHTNSPLVILVNTKNISVKSIVNLLSIRQFDKAVYIGTKEKLFFQMGLFGNLERVMLQFPHPKDLIRSNIRNSHGRPIGYTYVYEPWPLAFDWIHQTAQYLNTNLTRYLEICTAVTPSVQCLQRLAKASYIDIVMDKRESTE